MEESTLLPPVIDITDNPITSKEEDKYSTSNFSEMLFKILSRIEKPYGEIISILGPWGSGKTSAINILKHIIHEKKINLFSTDFNCLWYEGETPLALNFLQNLITLYKDDPKISKHFKSIARITLKGLPTMMGMAGSPLPKEAGKFLDYCEKYFDENRTVEETFNKLKEQLSKCPKRTLIIIDDIDRLPKDQVIAIFKIVHFLGKLPNIYYLMLYDDSIIDPIFQEQKYSSDKNFLDKIIQLKIKFPEPDQKIILDELFTKAKKEISSSTPQDHIRINNIIYGLISPYIKTPRDIKRLINHVKISQALVEREIDYLDILALETIKLHNPKLFKHIIYERNELCSQNSNQSAVNKILLYFNIENEKNYARYFLSLLFPERYSEEHLAYSRVRDLSVMTSYTKYELSRDIITKEKLQEMINNIGCESYFDNEFSIKTNTIIRKLDYIIAHRKQINPSKTLPCIKNIFRNYNNFFFLIDTPEKRDEYLFDIESKISLFIIDLIKDLNISNKYNEFIKIITDGNLNCLSSLTYYLMHDKDLFNIDHLPQETLTLIKSTYLDRISKEFTEIKDFSKIIDIRSFLITIFAFKEDGLSSQKIKLIEDSLEDLQVFFSVTDSYTTVRYTNNQPPKHFLSIVDGSHFNIERYEECLSRHLASVEQGSPEESKLLKIKTLLEDSRTI